MKGEEGGCTKPEYGGGGWKDVGRGGRTGASCRVGIPRPRCHGYRRGWFILEGLPPRYSLRKIVKTAGEPRRRYAEKLPLTARVLLLKLLPRGFPFRDLQCLHRLNV